MHIVLVGDSILDNGAHGPHHPDVASLLAEALGEGARVTLLAREGDVTSGIHYQLERVPAEATHLVLSVGGNDVLGFMELLRRPVGHVWEALEVLAATVDEFRTRYHEALASALEHGRPTLVCTIYNGSFPPEEQPVITTALRLFNDVILQAARGAGLPVAELRHLCREPEDFLNPIEPSVSGRRKIAGVVHQWVAPAPVEATAIAG
jgi:lysophospholipase L1-like esterase